jgi:hypothetical protein
VRKRVVAALVAVAICWIAQVGLSTEEKLESIYQSIVASSKKYTPDRYSVRIENKSLSESLKDLPEDILTGTPRVVIHFQKGKGVSMLVENVKEEYTQLFSMYEEYLQSSGISKVQNPSEFKSIMDMGNVSIQGEKDDTVTLKVWDPKAEVHDDNYALFTLDKGKWVIREVVYYLEGDPVIKLQNAYQFYGKYYMPESIVMTNLKDKTTEVFRFKDYQFGK